MGVDTKTIRRLFEMKNKGTIYFITQCAIVTALMCIFGPMSVPIGVIPISLTNLVIYFAVYVMGWKGSTISYVVYILLGLVGLPVFSGFQGGPAKLVGPTGGYLLGFVFITIIAGICADKAKGKLRIPVTIGGMVVSTAITYFFGTVWFMAQTGNDVTTSLGLCVFPFIPFDLGKMVIATLLGIPVSAALVKAGLINRK